MTHITCRLIAKNRDQLGNPTLVNRVSATFAFFTPDCHWQTFRRQTGLVARRWTAGTRLEPTTGWPDSDWRVKPIVYNSVDAELFRMSKIPADSRRVNAHRLTRQTFAFATISQNVVRKRRTSYVDIAVSRNCCCLQFDHAAVAKWFNISARRVAFSPVCLYVLTQLYYCCFHRQ